MLVVCHINPITTVRRFNILSRYYPKGTANTNLHSGRSVCGSRLLDYFCAVSGPCDRRTSSRQSTVQCVDQIYFTPINISSISFLPSFNQTTYMGFWVSLSYAMPIETTLCTLRAAQWRLSLSGFHQGSIRLISVIRFIYAYLNSTINTCIEIFHHQVVRYHYHLQSTLVQHSVISSCICLFIKKRHCF